MDRKLETYLNFEVLITPLGSGANFHFEQFSQGNSTLKRQEKIGFEGESYFAGMFTQWSENKFDKLLMEAVKQLKEKNSKALLSHSKTLYILSSTKGNRTDFPKDTFRSSREIVQRELEAAHPLLIVSNACISGLVAIQTAVDYLHSGKYDQIFVIGIDLIDEFILYGFESLFALSKTICKPFDAKRDGINLGEACGIVSIRREQSTEFAARYISGASSNDANHISGPSRTGAGLVKALNLCFDRAQMDASQVDFISAHGTATKFNDEMECIAFTRLKLEKTPCHSLKPLVGHSLGASGVIEILLELTSLNKGLFFKNLGFESSDSETPIEILTQNKEIQVQNLLKTASGFGGGNAAILIEKP
ncbi:beta-ketoacyl synthase N-terminal-like domain-containing protein [Flavobacterium sp.]|uniref:beta-ketoacyl synthase N-terminal-like domain-containing protein n=1 Tax=Flavobacterium sp. TaxID=239 RepID=UPI002609145B|nr:beta-ketoacyl synthase N-terminal-like domain-containing protein [Flavobacterium sp.]MDD3005823.1 beta-ketoacyl synthase N-terminal-like domain-containing protein [Flavobacterium sp.]